MHFQRLFLSSLSLFLLSSPFSTLAEQIPMASPHSDNAPYVPLTHPKPTLADLLTIESSASIFYSYARELELSRMFSDSATPKFTILVPTNKAVMALSRKPHQGPAPADGDEGIVITEEEFEARSKENVRQWIQAHIIPQSPIELESHTYDTLLEGKSISFKPISRNNGNGPEWSRVTLEDGVRIVQMKEGLNGVLYLIDGTVQID